MKFEEKMKELDQIIEQLQSQNIEIQSAAELYRKGLQLSEECLKELESVKLSIATTDGTTIDL